MLDSNIKNVFFSYEGGGGIAASLSRNALYNPENLTQLLTSHYRLDMPDTANRENILYIHMTTKPKDCLTFSAYDACNFSRPDFDFNKTAASLVELRVPLGIAVGSKDWQFYIESKGSGIINVETPANASVIWEAQANLHDHLADKLNVYLREKGLRQIEMDEEDLKDSEFHAALIGIFLEYREMAHNPSSIARKLGYGSY